MRGVENFVQEMQDCVFLGSFRFYLLQHVPDKITEPKEGTICCEMALNYLTMIFTFSPFCSLTKIGLRWSKKRNKYNITTYNIQGAIQKVINGHFCPNKTHFKFSRLATQFSVSHSTTTARVFLRNSIYFLLNFIFSDMRTCKLVDLRMQSGYMYLLTQWLIIWLYFVQVLGIPITSC